MSLFLSTIRSSAVVWSVCVMCCCWCGFIFSPAAHPRDMHTFSLVLSNKLRHVEHAEFDKRNDISPSSSSSTHHSTIQREENLLDSNVTQNDKLRRDSNVLSELRLWHSIQAFSSVWLCIFYVKIHIIKMNRHRRMKLLRTPSTTIRTHPRTEHKFIGSLSIADNKWCETILLFLCHIVPK